MYIYHIWANLKPGTRDMEFVEAVNHYLTNLQADGKLEHYRIMRKALGLGLEALLDFHIMLEFRDMQQLEQSFDTVAARQDPVESLHHAVNSKVSGFKAALYRDFPDAVRTTGQEKF